MDPLSEFLLARFAEDEAVARAAEPGPWRTEKYDANVLLTGERANTAVAIGPWGSDIGDSAVHMVRWDPSRVLAECDAKRRIVEKLLTTRHEVVDDCWYTCAEATEDHDRGTCCDDSRRGTGCDCGRDRRVETYLRLLALPFADHPDYDPAWRP